MTAVESSYERLDRLIASTLRPDPSFLAASTPPAQKGQDLRRLVEGWTRSAHDDLDHEWLDLCIVTGDGRYLETRGKSTDHSLRFRGGAYLLLNGYFQIPLILNA